MRISRIDFTSYPETQHISRIRASRCHKLAVVHMSHPRPVSSHQILLQSAASAAKTPIGVSVRASGPQADARSFLSQPDPGDRRLRAVHSSLDTFRFVFAHARNCTKQQAWNFGDSPELEAPAGRSNHSRPAGCGPQALLVTATGPAGVAGLIGGLRSFGCSEAI